MLNMGESKLLIDLEEVRDIISIFEEYQDAYNESNSEYSVENLR